MTDPLPTLPVLRTYVPTRPAAWRAAAWREHWRDLAGSREVVLALIKRDFRANYRQSVLGYLWAVLIPLATIGLFAGLNRAGIVQRGEIEAPYIVYALVGLTCWQVFAGGITAALSNVAGGAGLMSKIRLPLEVLVFAAFGQTFIQCGVRAVLVAIACVVAGFGPALSAWWALPLLVPLTLVSLAVGLVVAAINLILRDLGHAIALVINLALLLTPILYAAPSGGWLAEVNRWNPLILLVTSPRDAVLGLPLASWPTLGLMTLGSVGLVLVAWQAAYWVQARVMERAA